MINPELEKYIQQSLSSGAAGDEIKKALRDNGWPQAEVEEALAQLSAGQAAEPATAAPAAEDYTAMLALPEKKKRSKALLAALVAVGILLFGGVAWAGYSYYSAAPQRNFQKMTDAMMAVKSFEYTAETQTEINGLALPALQPGQSWWEEGETATQAQPIKYNSSVSGAVNFSELSRPQFSGSINLNSEKLFSGAVELEFRFVQQALYLQLAQIPKIETVDLSPLKNQWIKIDFEEILNQLNALDKTSASAEFKSKFSTEKIQKLQESLKKFPIFKITKKFPDETLAGVITRHYGFDLDKEALVNFSAEASSIFLEKPPTEPEISEMRKGLEELKLLNNEIWIGKNDSLLYKLVVNSEMSAGEKPGVSGKSSSILTMKNHNLPIKVETPEASKSFQEWLGEILNSVPIALPPADAER